MLAQGNLDYIVEVGYKEGYNGTDQKLPEDEERQDQKKMLSIITHLVNGENLTILPPVQHRDKLIFKEP